MKFPLQHHTVLGNDTINIGTIAGGTSVYQGPGSCRFTCDIRWAPPRTSQHIRERVRAILESLQERDENFKLGHLKVIEERDPLEFGANSTFVHSVKESAREIIAGELESIGWYSAGEIYPIFQARHIDEGIMFGPGVPWLAHHVDEHLAIEDLVQGAKFYAAIILRLCAKGR
jgi:acetylornithine deacetylase/succinyl-diaminopimelate desuccinylase-like protein